MIHMQNPLGERQSAREIGEPGKVARICGKGSLSCCADLGGSFAELFLLWGS